MGSFEGNHRIDWDKHQAIKIDGIERDLNIRDVPLALYSRICHYMLENSYRKNAIYKHLKFYEDPEIEQDYMRMVQHMLRMECSVMVIDEVRNEILGVALAKCMPKEWRSWTNCQLIPQSAKLADFCKLQYLFMLEYQKTYPQRTIDTLHLFELCLHKELEGNKIFVEKFFDAVRETARNANKPRVTFMATRWEEQKVVKAAGFTDVATVIYSLITGTNGRQYHSLDTIGQTAMTLYEYCVKPLPPYIDVTNCLGDEGDQEKLLQQLENGLELNRKKREREANRMS